MPTPPNNDWNYLTVELTHAYAEGDPDLYGLFYNASDPKYPSGMETPILPTSHVPFTVHFGPAVVQQPYTTRTRPSVLKASHHQ